MTDSPGEPFLELPNTHIPDQPPPPNKLLFRLCNNINVASINIRNPLTNDNVPDSELIRAGVTSLNRLHEILSSPFNTPDRNVDRTVWLRFALELFATLHEGLLSSQISAPDLLGTTALPAPTFTDISNAFTDLSTDEKDLISTIEEILGWTYDFFENEDEKCSDLTDRAHRTLCYRCVESTHNPFSNKADNDEKIKSVLLSVDFDARAMRDTLLNQAIREVHAEVDVWRNTQRNHLISTITDTIISDDPSTETLAVLVAPLDPRLQTWIDSKKSDLRAYARLRLANQACEDTIDQQFTELVEERIHRHRSSLDSEVTTRTADLRQAFDEELAACKAAFQTELNNAKAQIRKTYDADVEAARLEAHELLA
jgi:hypothetical protein